MATDSPNRRNHNQKMVDEYAGLDNLAVSEDGDKIRVKDIVNQPRWLKWLLYTTLLFIIFIIIYAVGKTVPWEPLQIEEVHIEPAYSCGGEEIEVTYSGELEGGLYTVDRIDGFAYWLSGEDDRPYSSIYFNLLSIEPFPYMEFPGPTRRIAPWPEDDWHAGVDATVYGKRLGFISVQQELKLESEDTLTTYDRLDEHCTTQDHEQNRQS